MAIFDRFKKALASGKVQAAENSPVRLEGGKPDCDPSLPEKKSALAKAEKQERIAQLTPREQDLFLLLLEGYTLKESANLLSVKYSTANTHMSGIYRKLGVSSRAELIIGYRFAAGSNGKEFK